MLYWSRLCGGPTMSVIALKCPDIKVIVVDKSENKITLGIEVFKKYLYLNQA